MRLRQTAARTAARAVGSAHHTRQHLLAACKESMVVKRPAWRAPRTFTSSFNDATDKKAFARLLKWSEHAMHFLVEDRDTNHLPLWIKHDPRILSFSCTHRKGRGHHIAAGASFCIISGTTLELVFLCTDSTCKQAGLGSWVLFNGVRDICAANPQISSVVVQSCATAVGFYTKCSFAAVDRAKNRDLEALLYHDWGDECVLMTTTTTKLLQKLAPDLVITNEIEAPDLVITGVV